MTPAWTILSDDLTGLQAIAGEFARLGFRVGTGMSRVPSRKALESFEIYGFDTATRALQPGEAEAWVAEAARQIIAAGADRIFKHNDSILQGHVGAELRAIKATVRSANKPIVYAPACPNRGRVTRGGIQIEVDDQGNAVSAGLHRDLREVIERGTGLSSRVMDLAKLRDGAGGEMLASAPVDVVIADATTDRDLDLIVAASLQAGCHVLSGSVGLAAALARATVPQRRFAKPVLVMAGSLQAATQAQVEHLLGRTDCASFPLGDRQDGSAADLVQGLRAAIAAGLHCVVWTPRPSLAAAACGVYPVLPAEALHRLRRDLSAVLRGLLVAPTLALGGLVVAGGMTADLLLRDVLGITQFNGLGWLCEGMAMAIAGDGLHPGLAIVTKSGGWGPTGALSDAVDRFASWRSTQPAQLSLPTTLTLESVA